STLPIDARSILKTPRQQNICIVPPGTYHHFGVLNSVLKILSSVKESIDCIKITINIDGLPLTKSSQQQFWPILGSIVSYNNVFMIGVYHGNEKPADVNDFLKYFVDEMKDLCENGINIQGRNIPCRLEALIQTNSQSIKKVIYSHFTCVYKNVIGYIKLTIITFMYKLYICYIHNINCKNPQYKMIKYNGIVFKAGSLADSCCGLNDGTIVSIANIAYCTKRTIPVIIGYELLRQDNLFNVPCPSSLLGIYIVHLCSNLKSWPLQSIVKKYVKLLYEENRYAVFPLIYTQT
ncbi:hypothetical protein ALC62_15321, partial [Cyphomyrmex costatus]